MAFQSVSSRNVTAASNLSAIRGAAISNSNPALESNAARLGELDASTNEAWLANCSGRRVACKIETLQLAQLPLQNGSSRKKCVMDSAQSTEPRAC